MNDHPTAASATTSGCVLDGIRVLDLSRHVSGAHTSQLLSDFGAEVVMVEPPGGSPLRRSPAFPFLARGKKSVVLDLRHGPDVAEAIAMASGADIVIDTFRPGIAAGIGLGYDDLSAVNPGLIHTSISGFGSTGPLSGIAGYEALVMARIGGLDTLGPMVQRPGPAFASVPFCSFSAAQTALHGTLAALLERERSGIGQRVETSLVQGIAAHDIWNWFLRIITTRYPDAFSPAPHVENGTPNSALVFRLLVSLSSDGRWLQFSQTSRHLYVALMDMLGMKWMFDDPEWCDIPLLEKPAQRVELWDRMLDEVRTRSADEWRAAFDEFANVWAEEFRSGAAVLQHPQLVHAGSVVDVESPGYGMVRQPAALARLSDTPARVHTPPPTIDQHADVLGSWAARPVPNAGATPSSAAPLAGLTVLELGLFYSAPYAAALLADLGARVIKVEPLEGDPLRSLSTFPEVGGIKAMQGKESICVDLATPEGRAIVHRLAASADLVLQSFRAGVAERLGVDAITLRELNPDLVYVNAQGYGSDGPCGHRPAYAPTIAAASGIAWRMAGEAMPADPAMLTLDEVKQAAVSLIAATNASFAQCDGLGALANATSMLLGLVARARGHGAQIVDTSMLLSAVHANCEDVVSYPGRPASPLAGADLLGPCARYRLYEASDGWVVLACPDDAEWDALARVLGPFVDLAGDSRFARPADRSANDRALGAALSDVLRERPASFWETMLTDAGVGCQRVRNGPVEAVMLEDVAPACGLVVEVEHPMLGVHPRLGPLVTFSRAQLTVSPGGLAGDHTDEVLRCAGLTDEAIAELRRTKVVA